MAELVRGSDHAVGSADGGEAAAGPVGKATLTSALPRRPVQRKEAGGAPLPPAAQATFEGSLGTSLSDVRVHSDAGAAAAASSIGARAFTVGQDIHFNAGQYAPDDPYGLHLLAHEVAHTAQQREGVGAPQAKLEVGDADGASEREADGAADRMVRGQPARVTPVSPTIARVADGAAPGGGGASGGPATAGTAEGAGAETTADDGDAGGGDDGEGGGAWDLAGAAALENDEAGGGAGATSGAASASTSVQRSASGAARPGAGEQPSAEDAVAAARGQSGQAPDPGVRRKVEAVTGAELSGARVHTGGPSSAAAEAIGAHAFAVDQEVHFADGQYRPGTHDGDRLLAHELVHTAQQARGQGSVLQPHLEVSQPTDAAELEADAIADVVVSRGDLGGGPTHPVGAPGEGLHRNPGASVVTAVARRALKWLAKRGANVSAHVAKRHVANRLGKSTFANGGKMVKKWTEDTLKNPGNVVDQGRRLVFEKAFGHPVGKGGERIVRVVIDKVTGKVVTAFPTQAFKTALVAVAATAAITKAGEADAAIVKRRAAIQKALEPSTLQKVIDLIIGSSSVARDEDLLAEERIVERKIREAIAAAEEELKRSLSPDEREQVREQILLDMQTEPSAGVIE